MQSIILKTATRLMVGLMLVFAVYLLLRGHHEPGGGFSAALLAGTAFALFAITQGPDQVRQAIRIPPSAMAMTGLALAVSAGLPALFTSKPFLTGIWQHSGAIWVGTPLVFDLGVFFAVLGGILSVLLALEEN
ncbi:MAG: Na(+)/H(+) antiporter subunit B [Desulfotignum sp.]|nr:Na(+)/H(+) antiporter subunit B [Desulfotignum sp.]MCF8125777.1 Na(+)/H(+) antiporter subunit B [Desulfotignum sp.]